jgi:hypothetical protein
VTAARLRHIAVGDLLATGTHRGVLDFGSYRLKPTGADAVLHLRELLDVREDKIAGSVLTFNVNDRVNQLTSVDYDELAKRVDAICALRNDLAHAANERRRGVTKQLGAELDAARRAVRPHFNR